jgi:hypothetical protein
LSLSLVARCQSGDSDLEKVGGTNVVPFLFDERMKDFLFSLSLLFEVSRVFAGSHISQVSFRYSQGWLPPN